MTLHSTHWDDVCAGDILVSSGARRWEVISSHNGSMTVRDLETGAVETAEKQRPYWAVAVEKLSTQIEERLK